MFHNSKGRIISSIGLTLGLVLLLAAAACGESTPTPTATPLPPIAAAVTPAATPLPPIAAAAAPTATPATAGRSYRHPECYPYLDRYPTTASGANRNADPGAIANPGSGVSTSNTRSGAYVPRRTLRRQRLHRPHRLRPFPLQHRRRRQRRHPHQAPPAVPPSPVRTGGSPDRSQCLFPAILHICLHRWRA